MPGDKVGVLNASVTGNQAQMAVFDVLARLVSKSPWFAQFAPNVLADRIEFAGPNVVALSGNSSSKGVEGVAWVAVGADELSRLPEDENFGPRQARDLIEPVEDTMVSRGGPEFQATRRAVLASWPEHAGDYVGARIERARATGVAEDLTATFEACPIDRDPARDAERREEIAQAPFNESKPEVFLSKDGTLCVVAPTWEVKPDADLGELRARHEASVFDFARRFGARPLASGEHPVVRDIEGFVRAANPARAHPVGLDGRFVEGFKGSREFLYYGHIDLGVRHDAAGLALAHYDGGKCVYDLLWKIRPPEGGELRIRDLLAIFGELSRRGFTLAKVTHDGYQGIAVGQDLGDLGIESELFSVDRDRRAYDTWSAKRAEGALDYYASEDLIGEVKSLVNLAKKIDHVPGGSKDLCDAAAAACYHVFDSVVSLGG